MTGHFISLYDNGASMATVANRQWICQLCGHIYDEAIGDPAQGIAPGTRLEELPDSWCCPDCGASRDDFELV